MTKREDFEWEGQQAQTEKVPLIDPGTGKPYILRVFEFAINPEFIHNNPGLTTLTQQDVFNMHWRQIRDMLWADGLIASQRVEPRLIFAKNNKKYRIFLLCEPKIGVMVADRPATLTQVLAKNK